jgi:hypothetical protein
MLPSIDLNSNEDDYQAMHIISISVIRLGDVSSYSPNPSKLPQTLLSLHGYVMPPVTY